MRRSRRTCSLFVQMISIHNVPLSPKRLNPRMLTVCARALCTISVAVLILVPCFAAESDAPRRSPVQGAQSNATRLYSMKFLGRNVESLEQTLKAVFPKDNVVVAPSAKYVMLDSFEIRDVRLKELGKTIEFLSDGRLSVEISEMEEGAVGNIWRIGPKKTTGARETPTLKMRSIAAPHLFKDEEQVGRLIKDTKNLEQIRLSRMEESVMVRGGDLFGVAQTKLEPLPQQKLFVIMGTEEGIAGVESFIKAAEQLAAEAAARKLALADSLAPKLRAVLAPHLFANPERLARVQDECNNVQEKWTKSQMDLMKMAGMDNPRGGISLEPRREQKIFLLIGSDEGIAGMESLILAAERNAAEEDAQKMALIVAERAEAKAKEETHRKAQEAPEKAKKSDQ